MEGALRLGVAGGSRLARCAAVAGCATEGGIAQGRRFLRAGQTLARRGRGFAGGIVRLGHHDVVRPLHLHAAPKLGNKARNRAADGQPHQQAERGKLRRRNVGSQQERLVHAADRAFPCAALPAVAGGLPQAAHRQALGLALLDSLLDQVVRGRNGLKRLHAKLHPQHLSLLIWRRGARPRKTVMSRRSSSTSPEPRTQRPYRRSFPQAQRPASQGTDHRPSRWPGPGPRKPNARIIACAPGPSAIRAPTFSPA